eukprot:scaffold73855_cov63-Phaeocystis_antarctica.AAC.2
MDVPAAWWAHVSGWTRLPRHRGRRAKHTWQDVPLDEGDEARMDAQVSKLLILDDGRGAGGAPRTGGDHRRAAGKNAEQRHGVSARDDGWTKRSALASSMANICEGSSRRGLVSFFGCSLAPGGGTRPTGRNTPNFPLVSIAVTDFAFLTFGTRNP